MTARNIESPDADLTGVVVVLAKEPRPGEVKTRLCPPLSSEMAARCHEAFVADTLSRVGAAVSPCVERELAVAPAGAAPRLSALASASGWRCVDQEGSDLGARMRGRLAAAVARGKRVVLIGADSPDLPLERITEAFLALEQAGVVIGPATDGGYYLIGCSREVPDVFTGGIAWGGPSVLEVTLARLRSAGRAVVELEPWPDVDDWSGLVALAKRLRAQRGGGVDPVPRSTLGVLAELARQGLPL